MLRTSTLLLLLVLVLAVAQPTLAQAEPPPEPSEPAESPFNPLFSAIAAFFNFLWQGIQAVGAALGYVVEGFKLVGAGFMAVGELFGQPGDPATYYTVASRALFDQTARQAVANCSSVKLGELAHIVPQWAKSTDTFCRVVPTGILGFIATSIHTASQSYTVLVQIGKWFVFLWLAAVLLIVVWGMERSAKTHSFEPLAQAFETAGKIFLLPFKAIWKLIEFILKFIQAVAEFLDTVLGPLT